jgi:hypothetical protein
VRRPERLGIERGVGVGDDRGDRILDTRRNPRLVDERLELRWFVEDLASVAVLSGPGPRATTCLRREHAG